MQESLFWIFYLALQPVDNILYLNFVALQTPERATRYDTGWNKCKAISSTFVSAPPIFVSIFLLRRVSVLQTCGWDAGLPISAGCQLVAVRFMVSQRDSPAAARRGLPGMATRLPFCLGPWESVSGQLRWKGEYGSERIGKNITISRGLSLSCAAGANK